MEIVCIKRHDFCFSCDFVPEPQDEKERDAEIGRNDISPVDMRCEKCLVVLGECHNQANGNGKNRAERIPFRSVRKFIERVPLREKSFAEPVMADADAEPENKAGDADRIHQPDIYNTVPENGSEKRKHTDNCG